MIEGLLVLLGCQLVGELVSRATHLPLPGPVLGMLVLLGLLARHRPGPEHPVVVGVLAGTTVAMASAVLTVRVLGGTRTLEATLAPKSATTPIAIALSQAAGGLPALTAVCTVLTGVLGAVAGPALLDLLGIREPQVRGLAMGVSAHGIGTSRALHEHALTGAFAALAMALTGVSTSLLLPLVLALLH